MNKLRLLPILIFGLLTVFVVSCSKKEENPNGGTGHTDLQVYVVNSSQVPVSGATVTIYLSAADRDASTNSSGAGVTGGNGFVYFSELTSQTFYIKVVKELQSATADTGVPIKEKEQTAVTVVLQ